MRVAIYVPAWLAESNIAKFLDHRLPLSCWLGAPLVGLMTASRSQGNSKVAPVPLLPSPPSTKRLLIGCEPDTSAEQRRCRP